MVTSRLGFPSVTISCMTRSATHPTYRRSPRPATLTQVVKQFQQEWTTQLEPEAIFSVCHDIGYEWRER